MDQPAHLGGFAVGVAVAWLLTTERASSLAWTGLAMAYAVLIAAATKPWGFHPNRIEAEALTSYGERYATGRGLPRNEPRAERFLRIACTAGDEEACSDIGRLLNRR
jgi:TPR repeat protein